jgi:transglutaminase-like putative cysteine protease
VDIGTDLGEIRGAAADTLKCSVMGGYLQTFGNSFAENETIKKAFAGHKMLILGAAAAIIVAAGWNLARVSDDSGNLKPKAAGYTIAKNIQYSYTLQNKTNRVIDKAEFWAHAPVKQTANQRCQDLTANYPFELNSDKYGNQVLHFTFEKLAPYASRIITIKANLMVSSSANPIAAEPETSDLLPEKYIESEHPAIRRAAAKLQESDTLATIKAVFHWVASQVRYSGYAAQDRGALYALQHKKGDCTEYMDLFVALSRANGLPSRRVGGYISPEDTVLKARDFHNWAEFYENGVWKIADPQNKVLMQNQGDYIAMRIIRESKENLLGGYNRFRVRGEGLKARMN